MPIDYSTVSLLASVKVRSMNASNQNTFTDDDMIRIASEELQSVLIPFIESVKGEYWVQIEDQPYVPGQTKYTMPERATGTKLRDVCLVDGQGNEVLLNNINIEDMKSSWAYAPYQFGFYLQDNQVVLVLGNLIGSGNYRNVRMKYFRRPNTLINTDQAGKVLNINTLTKEVTLSFAPTTWTTATLFDCINSMSPFQSRVDNQTITGIAGFILTFSAIPSGLSVGDWVSEANFSPIPQVPVEAHRLLEILTAARILQYSGDPSFTVFQAEANEAKKELIQVISPRVDGSPRKIPIRNRLWGPW
jgi:hypothetical protein